MLMASGRPTGPGGSEMRTPGKPERSLVGDPGTWNTQNRPVSSVIRCPDTFSSATRPVVAAVLGAGLAGDALGAAAVMASDMQYSRSGSCSYPESGNSCLVDRCSATSALL